MDIQVTLGQYSFPILLSMVLAFLYQFFEKQDGTSYLSDRMKNGFAVLMAVGLAVATMPYNNIIMTYKSVIDYILYGFSQGLMAVGFYKTVQVQIKGNKTEVHLVRNSNGLGGIISNGVKKIPPVPVETPEVVKKGE